MELAFYIFTMLILLLVAGSGMISLSAYFVSRKKSFIYATFFFLFYFLETALIFQFEYAAQNMEFTLDGFYAIDNPYLRIALGAGMLESLMLVAYDFCGEKRLLLKVLPAVSFVVLCVLVVLLLPEGNTQQWIFYTLRQVFLLWILLFVAFKYLSSKNEFYRRRLRQQKKLFWIAAALIVLIIIEDTVVILLWNPTVDTSLVLLYVSQRNFSENALVLVAVVVTMRASASMLRLRFHEPPHPADNPTAQTYVEETLPAFCSRYELTDRERDIFSLILVGKNTDAIARELHLATGTVKTHVHNILHKTNQENRNDLVHEFWRE